MSSGLIINISERTCAIYVTQDIWRQSLSSIAFAISYQMVICLLCIHFYCSFMLILTVLHLSVRRKVLLSQQNSKCVTRTSTLIDVEKIIFLTIQTLFGWRTDYLSHNGQTRSYPWHECSFVVPDQASWRRKINATVYLQLKCTSN